MQIKTTMSYHQIARNENIHGILGYHGLHERSQSKNNIYNMISIIQYKEQVIDRQICCFFNGCIHRCAGLQKQKCAW